MTVLCLCQTVTFAGSWDNPGSKGPLLQAVVVGRWGKAVRALTGQAGELPSVETARLAWSLLLCFVVERFLPSCSPSCAFCCVSWFFCLFFLLFFLNICSVWILGCFQRNEILHYSAPSLQVRCLSGWRLLLPNTNVPVWWSGPTLVITKSTLG